MNLVPTSSYGRKPRTSIDAALATLRKMDVVRIVNADPDMIIGSDAGDAMIRDGDGRIVQIGADDLWRWGTMEGGEAVLQVFWLEVVGAASGEVWSAESEAR